MTIEYHEAWTQLHRGRLGISGTLNQFLHRAPVVLAIDTQRDIGWNENAVVWPTINTTASVRVAQFTTWTAANGGTIISAGHFTVAHIVHPGDTISIAPRALVLGGSATVGSVTGNADFSGSFSNTSGTVSFTNKVSGSAAGQWNFTGGTVTMTSINGTISFGSLSGTSTINGSGNAARLRSQRNSTAVDTLLTFWPPGPEARMKRSV